MALIFEQFLTEELGDASYLIGDDASHTAAVVDPQVDVERYLETARKHGLAIKHVVQTHIHEDFLCGASALAAAVPGAQVCVSGHEAPAYGFPHRLVHEGDVLEVGCTTLTVKFTPGHTPEHISLLVAQEGDAPFAVLSGGSLLVGAAGRTDLLGKERVDELVSSQFKTLHGFYLQLADGVLVYPTHVHGSPCGADIGDKVSTTIGYERQHNPLLQPKDEAGFRELALDDLPPKPRYYPRLKERNTASQPRSGPPDAVRPLPAKEFKAALDQGDAVLVDTRHLLAFGGGHIPGATHIGATGHLGIWAGWMLDAKRPLLLVLDNDSKLAEVLVHFARTGFDRFAGYLAGGMSAWENAGLPLQALPQLHVDHVAERQKSANLVVVDVRSPQEWKKGHVPGARHLFLPEVPERLSELPRDKPVAVYCDSGYRASIAASLLQRNGFDVSNIPGSWQAWKARGLPVEK